MHALGLQKTYNQKIGRIVEGAPFQKLKIILFFKEVVVIGSPLESITFKLLLFYVHWYFILIHICVRVWDLRNYSYRLL